MLWLFCCAGLTVMVWMRKREFVTQMNRIIQRGEWVKIVKLYYKGKAA